MDQHSPSPVNTAPDLNTVLADVLANLAFMVSDDEPAAPPPQTVWLEGEIHYQGPQRGRLQCWCTQPFAVQLAANLLGTEPDDRQAQQAGHDAVREFMNVLCGQFVTARYGTRPVFSLTIPTVHNCGGPPDLSDAPPHDACWLSVGGEPFLCRHCVEP